MSKSCGYCGNQFVPVHNRINYCSFACRFWSKVKKGAGCWNWMAGVDSWGYGHINSLLETGASKTKAHRYSWAIHNGPIPSGLMVLHKCDNTRCVNPEHLFLGTHTDNMRDMAAKKRVVYEPFARGHENPMAKLDENAVRKIRASYPGVSQQVLAKRYGVNSRTISKIITGTRWKHV